MLIGVYSDGLYIVVVSKQSSVRSCQFAFQLLGCSRTVISAEKVRLCDFWFSKLLWIALNALNFKVWISLNTRQPQVNGDLLGGELESNTLGATSKTVTWDQNGDVEHHKIMNHSKLIFQSISEISISRRADRPTQVTRAHLSKSQCFSINWQINLKKSKLEFSVRIA